MALGMGLGDGVVTGRMGHTRPTWSCWQTWRSRRRPQSPCSENWKMTLLKPKSLKRLAHLSSNQKAGSLFVAGRSFPWFGFQFEQLETKAVEVTKVQHLQEMGVVIDFRVPNDWGWLGFWVCFGCFGFHHPQILGLSSCGSLRLFLVTCWWLLLKLFWEMTQESFETLRENPEKAKPKAVKAWHGSGHWC